MRLSFEIGVGGDARKLRVRLGESTVTDEHVIPLDPERLEKCARSLVGVLRRANRSRSLAEDALSELRFLGDELNRMLLPAPIEAQLRHGNGPLLLDLDEALVPVPFELIFDGQSFLCRRYALGRSVRSSVPRRGQERRSLGIPPRALVIAADPRGDLSEVHQESDAIVNALEKERVRARLAGDLSRDALRRELKDFDIVHFAGHADFIVDDPKASGWHLSSGKLTAADIAELAGGRPMPLVIFSNSCESGRTGAWTDDDASGEARRAYGLAGAFLYAGVRHYVGTQWEVIDGHSATFAKAFYANLASGQAIGAAVQHARQAVIESGGEGAMAWASYVLYGDPDDRPLRRSDQKQLSMPSAKELAARESAPWKRPTPETMKRVGAQIMARREEPEKRRMNATTRALLWGALAGLIVTGATGTVMWVQRQPAARLVILPISSERGDPGAGRIEACLEGAFAAKSTPVVGAAQLRALGSTTQLIVTDDKRALKLATALGARWALWGTLDNTPGQAEMRLLDVKSGAELGTAKIPTDDLGGVCAEEAQRLGRALRDR